MTSSPSRPGFTLVELIVVMAIIVFVASLAVLFLPSATSEAREANAAMAVQNWLNLARQRALRDQAPRGLRLWIDDPQTFWVTRAEFIEQPDDYTGEKLTTLVPNGANPPYTQVKINGGSLFNGQTTTPAAWLVQPGDYLEITRSGLMHRITGIDVIADNASPPNYSAVLTLNTGLQFAINTTNYRILRTPRPLGDEALTLPQDCVIDLSTNKTYQNSSGVKYNPLPPLTGTALDLLFAPSGALMNTSVTTDTINLWVRALDPVTPNDVYAGNPSIVALFVRTGFVGAYAPSPAARTDPTKNPYTLIH